MPSRSPLLVHDGKGGELVGELMAHGGALPQACLDAPVVLHHQLVFQSQRAGGGGGLDQGADQLPGGEADAHPHQPDGHPVEEPREIPVAYGVQLQAQIAGQIPAPQGRDRPAAPQDHGAPEDRPARGAQEVPAPAQKQEQEHQQPAQHQDAVPDEKGAPWLRQKVVTAAQGDGIDRQPHGGQNGKQEPGVRRAAQDTQQKEPPQQDQCQGRGPRREGEVIGDGHYPLDVGWVVGQPQEGRELVHRLSQGTQLHHQPLAAAGGQRQMDLPQIGGVGQQLRGGDIQARSVHGHREGHAAVFKDEPASVSLPLRQGHGEAEKLPLLQGRRPLHGVKKPLRSVGRDGGRRLPHQVWHSPGSDGELTEELEQKHTREQEGQDEDQPPPPSDILRYPFHFPTPFLPPFE